MDDRILDFIAEAPGYGVAIILVWFFLRALKHLLSEHKTTLAARDAVITSISEEHNAAFKANSEVLRENSIALGECSAILKDCREEIQRARRRPA